MEVESGDVKVGKEVVILAVGVGIETVFCIMVPTGTLNHDDLEQQSAALGSQQ